MTTDQLANYHHRFVLICAWKGRGLVWRDDQCVALEPRQALLIFPFQKHYYVDIAPQKINWLFITFDHPAGALLETLRSQPAISLGDEAIQAALGLIRAWSANDEPMAPLFLAQLLHRLRKSARKKSVRSRGANTDKGFLGRVNSYAFEKRNRAVSINELAKALGFSPSHLRTLFRQQTGQSLGRHLRDFRLRYACSLIRGSNRRIGEIAEECGYESIFSFSRSFRQAYACSPSQYRTRGGTEEAR